MSSPAQSSPSAPPTVSADAAAQQLAGDLRVTIGLLVRRLRSRHTESALTLPETSALARLDRGGPATAAELARAEQIRPQSMGATLAGLEQRGFIVRTPDPNDGRRQKLSVTGAGLDALRVRREASVERLAHALETGFSKPEIKALQAAAPLLERLAQSL